MIRQRLDQIDDRGTRGVTIIQAQVTDLIKDTADFRDETRGWQRHHEGQHEQDQRDRTIARRWLVGAGIAGLASMATVITMLLDVLSHVH